MKKILTFRQVAALKRTAQNNYPNVAKLAKLRAKIEEIQDEINILNAQIDGAEMGSKALTGGYTSFDLIDREVVSTGKFDKDGRELKISKYVPKASALKALENGTFEIILGNDTLFSAEDTYKEPAAPTEEDPERYETVEEAPVVE